MSLFLRGFEILMMCMLCYTYQETIRTQYRPSVSRISPCLIIGFIIILISPWLSASRLRILLVIVLLLSVFLYRNDRLSYIFFVASIGVGEILIQVIISHNILLTHQPAIWLQSCLFCAVVFLMQLPLLFYRHMHYEQLYVPICDTLCLYRKSKAGCRAMDHLLYAGIVCAGHEIIQSLLLSGNPTG